MMREKDYWPATGLLADVPSDNVRETLYILLKLGILAIIVYLLFFPDVIEKNPWNLDDTPRASDGRTPVFAPAAVLDDGTRVEWSSCVVAAEDKNNRKIEVALGFLRGARSGASWDAFDWALGSTTHVGIDGAQPVRIEDAIVSSPEGETRPIIVLGTASHENSSHHPRHEEARAEARADRLANLLPQRHPGADVYTLNLGFFRERGGEICAPASASSASERRVVLMVVTQQEDGLDLSSGVRNALAEAAQVRQCGFDARSYSNFEESQLFHLLKRCTPEPA
jgi:hypothetical protein